MLAPLWFSEQASDCRGWLGANDTQYVEIWRRDGEQNSQAPQSQFIQNSHQWKVMVHRFDYQATRFEKSNSAKNIILGREKDKLLLARNSKQEQDLQLLGLVNDSHSELHSLPKQEVSFLGRSTSQKIERAHWNSPADSWAYIWEGKYGAELPQVSRPTFFEQEFPRVATSQHQTDVEYPSKKDIPQRHKKERPHSGSATR